MKTIFLWILILFPVSILSAQDSLQAKKTYKNELGLDITGFIRQFVANNQSLPQYYVPVYYLTYRRHFKFGSIRFAGGGEFSDEEISPGFASDSNEYSKSTASYDLRIGWEFPMVLSPHWQAFYGLDFRPSRGRYRNDAPYWNGGYANGTETKYEIYAATPILGIRYKPTRRISLTTEAGLSIIWENRYSRKYYIPVNSQYPPLPDVVNPNNKRVYSSFTQPLSVVFTFDL